MTGTGQPTWASSLMCIIALSSMLTGCLGSSYVIEPDEIARLERVPARDRGQRIRVVQRFSTTSTLPPAPAWQAPLPRPNGPSNARQGAAPLWAQAWVSPGLPTYQPFWATPHITSGGGGGHSPGLARRTVTSRGNGPSTSSALGRSTSTPSARTDSANVKTAIAVAIAAGVAVGIGLAVTEGARYDGWVAVHPQHPVHIIGRGDRHRVVALDNLRLNDMAPDEEAIIVRHEGAGMWQLGRAPLNRAGVTYGFDLGQSIVPMLNGRISSLTGGSMRLGLFTNDWFGVLPGIDMVFGSFDGASANVLTPNIQFVAIPLALWRLHIGIFGEMGWSSATFDALPRTQDPSGMRIAAGVLVQWEITTRLALDMRWSNHWLRRPNTRATTSFTAGFSIY